MTDSTPTTTLPVKRNDGFTIEENLTDNAREKIVPARYLQPGETPTEWIRRVAENIAIADAVHVEDPPKMRRDDVCDHFQGDDAIDSIFFKPAFPSRNDPDPDTTRDEVTLGEYNAWAFSYDAVWERADDATREQLDDTAAQFEDLMARLEFIPNTPTLMNAGTELQQLSACFVDSPADDISDIHTTIREAAEVFQSGGGMGYSFSRLRPYGDAVGSTGGVASGPISFMRTFDQMCETIAQGGTRRGAQMAIMSIDHPDVIEFIHAKRKDVSLAHTLKLNDPDDYTYTTFGEALEEARDLIDDEGRVPKHLRNAVEGHLSNFNISVGLSDAYTEALETVTDHTFINPRTDEPHIATEETKEMYARYDLGEYVEVGEPLTIPAKELHYALVEGAHQNGEPGWVHLDRINDEHSFDVDEYPEHEIIATNPCGEQPLEEYEACNLGHINLSTIVAEDAPDWRTYPDGGWSDQEPLSLRVGSFLDYALDWGVLYERIELATHFLDNVVTMSRFPIDEITETVKGQRKIGLGIMGLAQLYVQLGVKYGSPEANEIGRQVMRYINHTSKHVSHQLADDRGVFPHWQQSKYCNVEGNEEWVQKQTGLDDEWVQNLTDLGGDGEGGYQLRNHNTTTIAPTGTTSMVGDTTGGCEPIYNVAYFKNVSDDVQGDDMLVEFDDYFLRVLEANDIDTAEVKAEAEAQMNRNEFDGIDGLSTVPDSLAELFVTTADLTALEHARLQCALQEGVDSAISKTVNFPNDATRADVDEVFRHLIDNGAKGATVYRDGTRSKQVLTTRADNADHADLGEMDEDAARERVVALMDEFDLDGVAYIPEEPTPEEYAQKRERPDTLSGTTQRINTGYGRMYVNINGAADDPSRPFEVFANVGNSGGFTNSFTEALAKVTSTALRSGVDPEELASDLTGIRSPKVAWDNSQQINSIPDAIGVGMTRWMDTAEAEATMDADGGVRVPTTEEIAESTGQDPDQIQADADAGGAPLDPDELGEPPRKDDQDDPLLDRDPVSFNDDADAGATQDLIDAGESPECPDCGDLTLAYSEGCKTCESCGWSEC